MIFTPFGSDHTVEAGHVLLRDNVLCHERLGVLRPHWYYVHWDCLDRSVVALVSLKMMEVILRNHGLPDGLGLVLEAVPDRLGTAGL